MEYFTDTRKTSSETVNVEVYGEVDISSAFKLENSLANLIEQGYRHLVINLDKLKFIDMSGLSTLVLTLKKAREAHGSMALVCTKSPILKIFKLTGLTKIFKFVADADQASKPCIPELIAK